MKLRESRIEFSEALCSELRRKVNDSRKVKSIDSAVVDNSQLRDHDKAVIVSFLEDEFSSFILKIWQEAQHPEPWPNLQDWGFPGVALIALAERHELGEFFQPLMSKGSVFIISHSGLYNAKLSLVRD